MQRLGLAALLYQSRELVTVRKGRTEKLFWVWVDLAVSFSWILQCWNLYSGSDRDEYADPLSEGIHTI